MRIAILHQAVADDAPPDERDVLQQVDAVERALEELGHDPVRVPCDLRLEALRGALETIAPAVAFNLVESLAGQGRLVHVVPSLLEALGVPYTGASAEAIFATSNKRVAKSIMASARIPLPDVGPGPCIIKPVFEHASVGIDDDAIVKDAQTAERIVAERGRRDWFYERYVDGRELNIGVLDGPSGPEVLPLAELRFVDYPPGKPHIVGYAAKWDESSFEYRNTVRSFEFTPEDAPMVERAQRLALDCWRTFDLAGWARVDFRVAGEEVYVLEVNSNPCLSPDAGFAAALARRGVSYARAIDRIVQAALR